MRNIRFVTLVLVMVTAVLLSACNLTSAPEERLDITDVPTNTATPLETVTAISQIPTATSLPLITRIPPTSILPPTSIPFATATPSLTSIIILSPGFGNVVAGNVQVLGSAVHPTFLQYQLEYGPDPNPGNLWFPIGGSRLTPVFNNLLGIWSTQTIPDGVYQLRLRVFLRDGASLQSLANNIRVQNTQPTVVPTSTSATPRPIAAFTQDRVTGIAPLVVRFTNQSSGQITSYQWDFGDGSVSNEINPAHTFRNPGEYDVRLTVNGPGGRSNVSRRIFVSRGNPPVANFERSPRSGEAPLTVQFTDTSTGEITSRIWNFGDGTTSTESNLIHTYTQRGEYNVILEVRGPDGATVRTRSVTVIDPAIPAPVADFTPRETTGDAPLVVRFTSTSTGQNISHLWEFGDGSTSIDPNPIYQYSTPGEYVVRLTVTNAGGQTSVEGRVIVNRPVAAPDASFSAAPISGDAPLNVTFTNASTGDITAQEWDFDDGTKSTEVSPTHRFEAPGTYRVRLTVVGLNDLTDTAEVDITVTAPLAPPRAAFSVEPSQGNAPLEVTFTNESSGDNVNYEWAFGDGATSTTSEPVFSHIYADNGVYEAVLVVRGPNNATDSTTRTITVTDALRADFAFANLTDPPALGFQFTDTSTGDITEWRWTFGDNSETTERNPQYTYAASGTYNVTLTVSDGVNSDSISREVTATQPLPGAPVAGFQVTAIDGLTVTFADASSGEITNRQWDFGDGNTSGDASPTHTYAAGGTYNVTLTVSNAGGSNSTTQQVTVEPPLPGAPVAGFEIVAVNDLTVTFADASSGEITSRQWDFGDGNISGEASPTHTYTAGGTYNVTLTVSNAGGSDSTAQEVTVSAPVVDTSIAETTPIRPDINAIRADLEQIAGRGGKRADIFAVIGDRTVSPDSFLSQFGDGNYVFTVGGEDLNPVIGLYLNAQVSEGQNSFQRVGTAVINDLLASDLLGVPAPAPECNGETLLVCELRLAQPGVIYISVGYRDARQGTDLNNLRASLEQIVDIAANSGTIPVLMTVYPRPGEETQMKAVSEVIIEVANDRNVPVFNVWRLFTELPGSGLDGNNPSVSPEGADVLTDATVTQFGVNARNYNALRILKDIQDIVLR